MINVTIEMELSGNDKRKLKMLKITKEKVLEAAEKYSEAKEVLRTLFPEAFDKYFDLSKLKTLEYVDNGRIFSFDSCQYAGFDDYLFLQIRFGGEYANKGFYLSKNYKWQLVEDEDGALVLLPTKKSEEK